MNCLLFLILLKKISWGYVVSEDDSDKFYFAKHYTFN